MKTQAIVAAAGTGQRFGGDIPKPFVLLKGKPLVFFALEVFEKSSLIDSVIVSVHPEFVGKMEEIIREAGFRKTFQVAEGGRVRAESVSKALKFLSEDVDLVLVHDGARPLINVCFVEEMIRNAEHEDALIAALPLKPTIKKISLSGQSVIETLDRSCLREIQTPQIFKKEILVKAYEHGDLKATDDAALVEHLKKTVRIFPGLEENIKVTTPLDFFLAEKLLERCLG